MTSSTSLNGGSLSFVSQRLLALAQQLRHYKPPPCSLDDNEERIIEEAAGKVFSQVGFQESVTPVAQNPEKFRPKRAAVLICLFEGDAGDLRVILTKRSSRLSTHSGQSDSLFLFLKIRKLMVAEMLIFRFVELSTHLRKRIWDELLIG